MVKRKKEAMPSPRRLIVAISGSTGSHYGVRLLEVLRAHTEVEMHLILSAAARLTIEYEMRRDPGSIASLATHTHDERDIASALASGTFVTDGMVEELRAAVFLTGEKRVDDLRSVPRAIVGDTRRWADALDS